MKFYQFVLYSFIFVMVTLLYPSTPKALYQEWKNLPPAMMQITTVLPDPHPLNRRSMQQVNNIVIHYLNQEHFGISEYEKAQQELQQFNRPLIGIVGKDEDQVSYHGYQQKILGSSY